MLLSLLAACQAPFGTDRHDLVGFRIAAISARPAREGHAVSPRAALVVDGRLWAERPVDLAWYLLSDPDELVALDPLSPADATGPEPRLLVGPDRRVVGLIAKHDGREARAFLELAEPPATLGDPGPLSSAELPLSLPGLEGPELLLDARRDLDGVPADAVPPGGALRLHLPLDGDPLVRWMATAGTFLELDRSTADWFAADDLRLDEDELDGEPVPLEEGVVSVLALGLGAPGEGVYRATDVFVGEAPEGVWVEGRFVPGAGLPTLADGEALRTTLRQDPASPVGFSFDGGEVTDPAGVSDWGTPSLPCLVGKDGPLDPAWWLQGSCFTDGVDGLEVVAIPGPGPGGGR